MWQDLLDWTFTIFGGLSDFCNWLLTPFTLEALGVTYFSMRPIEILGIGGFITIIVLWIAKLFNPLS